MKPDRFKLSLTFMKNIIPLFLVALSLAACTEKSNPVTERQLLQMLDNKDFFRLETRLEKDRSQLSKSTVLYLETHLQNAFNRTEQSLQTIDTLLGGYTKSLNDTLLSNIYQLKFDNYVKQCRYGEAAEALKIAMDKYGHASDSTDLADLHEAYNTFEPLKALPPQKMHITADVTVPVSRNQFNHVIMRATCGGQSEDFVFDTGAMLSVASESCARRMGIHVLESSIKVGNSVGSKVQSKVGIADSLRIGNLLIENVTFLIIPDEMLSFTEINYAIHGIIGFPIMYQMKELILHKDESITVPVHPTKRDLHNLFLDGLSPIIRAETDCDTMLFKMDTGATSTEFSEKYFAAHKSEVLEKGVLKTAKRGGAGAIIDSEHYELEKFRVKIGGCELTLPTIDVMTEKLAFTEDYDGNLGQDVLMHFNKLILNFEDMYLALED